MREYGYIGKKTVRTDGRQKATGSFRYMTDIPVDDLLYGALVHPECAHALVDEIDVSEALACPGVVKVVTAEDVPGLNRHGLIFQDQPVFCDREVRYRGDTLAAVVAVSPEIARHAAGMVNVRLTPLPEVLTAEEALEEGTSPIHEGGNSAARYSYVNGDVSDAFSRAMRSWRKHSSPSIRNMRIWRPKEGRPDLFPTAGWKSGWAVRTRTGPPGIWP